jgi:hypothetical protein
MPSADSVSTSSSSGVSIVKEHSPAPHPRLAFIHQNLLVQVAVFADGTRLRYTSNASLSIILTSSVLFTWLMLVEAFGALGGLLFDRIGRIEASWAHLYDSTWAGLASRFWGWSSGISFFRISAALVPFALLSVAALVVERRWFRPLLQIRSHLPIAFGALALVV